LEEKYIFGYFQTMEAAQKAAQALKAHGFEAYVDRFSPIGGGHPYDSHEDGRRDPFTDPRMSLSESTLGGPRLNEDERILRSVNPDASGISGGQPMSSLEDVCVTVFMKPDRADEARKILEQYGARD
jgi:hypothetical protein